MKIMSDEDANKPIQGLIVADANVALQTIARVCSTGAIRDTELATLGNLRANLVSAIKDATGINYDEAVQNAIKSAQEASTEQ